MPKDDDPAKPEWLRAPKVQPPTVPLEGDAETSSVTNIDDLTAREEDPNFLAHPTALENQAGDHTEMIQDADLSLLGPHERAEYYQLQMFLERIPVFHAEAAARAEVPVENFPYHGMVRRFWLQARERMQRIINMARARNQPYQPITD